MFLVFTSRFVRTLRLSTTEMAARDFHLRHGDVRGVGYVRSTGTLLLCSSEPGQNHKLGDCWLELLAMEAGGWSVMHRVSLDSALHIHFCELTNARVLFGKLAYTSRRLHLFNVSSTHQVHFPVPDSSYWFDASIIDRDTFVALAHNHHNSVCIYELLSENVLEPRYQLDIYLPTQIIWCGNRLLVGSRDSPSRLSAVSRFSDTELRCTIDIRVVPDPFRVFVVGDRLAYISIDIRIYSLDEVQPFDETETTPEAITRLHRRSSITTES